MALKVCSLFSGIGGIDLGFKQAGYNIIWANEKDHAACNTYRYNFGNSGLVECDMKAIAANVLPNFDVLVAGFPCQPFSIAGKQKGFNDDRGNLFFEITRVVDAKRPKVIMLENVPNLIEHDSGRTFLVIFNSLAQFGYTVYYKVMSATEYGNLPQTRSRIYIIAVRDDLQHSYCHPNKIDLQTSISNIIDRTEKKNDIYYYTSGKVYDTLLMTVKDKTSIYRLFDYGERNNKSKVKPELIVQVVKNHMCPTLTANMGTYPDRVPVVIDNFGIRKLTLRECLDFQGFPTDFYFPNSITIEDAYKQIGNSVCVPIIKRIAKQIKLLFENHE